MRDVHHHPGGLIYIRGNLGDYKADVATFASDVAALGLPAYEGLPVMHRERQYQTGQHFLFSVVAQVAGLVPRSAGDAYLEAYPQLLARQASRA